MTPRAHSIDISHSGMDSGRQHSQSVPSMPVSHFASQQLDLSLGPRVIAKSISFHSGNAAPEHAANSPPLASSIDRASSAASMATTRENTCTQSSRRLSTLAMADSVGGAPNSVIAELPSRSHEKRQEAHIEASSVEVEVQDHDAGGGSQGAGLESQGGDLNDADQTKCMPCSLM